MTARLAAFGLLACSAFDWALPWLDRPGTAALGVGLAALELGRAPVAARPSTILPRPPAALDGLGLEAVPPELAGVFGRRGGSGEAADDDG